MLDEEVEKLQKAISDYEANIEKAQEYGKKMQDPTKYDEFRSESLGVYTKKLREMGLPEKTVGEDGVCRKLVVGKISSGKTSLLNSTLDLDLDTGMGETTLKPAIVYEQDKVQVIDTPGENEDFNTQNL